MTAVTTRGASTRRLTRDRGRERGSGTMLALGIIAVTVMVLLMIASAAPYLVALHRARAATDLAALAGAGRFATDGNAGTACDQVDRTARANGAVVAECSVTGDRLDFVVIVRASVPVAKPLPGLPAAVQARGQAGPVR